MGTRHLETVRSLSQSREKDKEEAAWQQQKREDLRLKKREREARERLAQRACTHPSAHRGSSTQQLPPPLPSGAAAAPPPEAPSDAKGDSSGGVAPEISPDSARKGSRSFAPDVRGAERRRTAAADGEDEMSPEEWKKHQARCNSDIERRQEEAIRKVQDRANLQKVKHEREQLKRQWRAYKAKSMVLSSCQNENLREYLESKAKPRALPKLPNIVGAQQSEKLDKAGAEDEQVPAASSSTATPTSAAEQDGVCGPSSAAPVEAGVSAVGASESLTPIAKRSGELSGVLKAEKSENDPSSPSRPPKAEKAERSEREARAMARFLTQQTLRVGKNCSDLTEWKKRNGVAPDKRVFICVGGYPDFREALLRRGWVQNQDKASPHFDLKWGMARDIDHEHILQNQVANHFDKCRELTTKVGLTLNLRNSYYWGVDIDSFYPRAYDLYDHNDRSDFVMNFKFSKAEAVLHAFLEHVESEADMTFSDDVVSTCIKICMRTVTDPVEVMDSPELAEALRTISAEEWSLLEKVSLDDVNARLEDSPGEKDLANMIQKRLPPTEHQRMAKERLQKEQEKEEKEGKKKKKKKKAAEEAEAEQAEPLCAPVESFKSKRGQHLVQKAKTVLEEMGEHDRQHSLNGSKNAWIIKPSGKSRGRGIKVVRELTEIFRQTESDGFQWICQKYMEQPHLVHGFKFDIRQWVLVTSWNPLTVYIWKHPYLRFAGQKYDGLASKDPYVHLTNNSIIKYMDGFEKKDEDLQGYGFMWFRQQYEAYIHATCCKRKHHKTPWMVPPPYTCESYGVRWEDVAFTAEEEDEEVYDETRGDSSEPPPPPPPPPPPAPAAGDGDGESDSEADEADAEGPPQSEGAKEATAAEVSRADSTAAPSSKESTGDEPAGDSSVPIVRSTWVASGDVDDDNEEACCENLWETSIAPQMEQQILWSLLNVSDTIVNRKNTYELYGYDFMISTGKEKPEVWLIEVNSSPACDYSTPVTCPLVKKMMEDTAKVMVDTRDDPAAGTGEWKLMEHKHTKPVSMRTCACSNLEVCGKRMKPPKGYKKKLKKIMKAAQAADSAADCDGASDGDDAD